MVYISVDEVLEGMTVGEAIKGEKGTILLAKGGHLTRRAIEGLKNRGIYEVLIETPESEGILVEQPITAETKNKIMKALKEFDVDAVSDLASNMVDELLMNGASVSEVLSIKTYDEYTYQHSFSVGLLSAIMGIAAQFKREEIENLTCAGLLHDLGKVNIDPEIINAPRKLSEAEFEEIKKHPGYAYDMLRDNMSISATIRVAAYEHHENEDGTGYPRHITGDAIHKFAKVIHICDVFDALTSNRPYRSPMPRADAINYVMEHSGTMFSDFYSEIFGDCVAPYPTGTVVKLADGSRAIVERNVPGELYNPEVRVHGQTVRLEEYNAKHSTPGNSYYL